MSCESTETKARFRELLRQGAPHQEIVALLVRYRATEESSWDDAG